MGFITKLLRFWVLLVFAVATGYFAIYNQEHIGLKLPPWIEQITVPAYAAFASFFLFGAAIVTLFFGFDSMRKTLHIRRLNRQIRVLGGTPYAPSRDDHDSLHTPSVDGPAAGLL